jgi:long-subunit acyl-CoA synthetase (AMP-forming)
MLLAGINLHPTQRAALEDGERRLTYGELCNLVEAERQWLAANGVQRCALLADNGCGWAIADLALLAAGIVNIPLPVYFVNSQIRHVLDDAGVAFIFTDRPEQLCREHDCARVGQSRSSGLTLLRRSTAHGPALPAGTLKITYTSGSTSEPKGVCLSGHALQRVSASLHAALGNLHLERHMCLLPLATLLENIAGIYVPLLLGIQSVLRPASAIGMSYGGLDAPRLLSALCDAQPSSLVLVPELLRLLVGTAQRGWQPPASLKFIAVGGASVPAALLEQATALGLPVFEGYGLSECASVVCLNLPGASRPGSVGRPLSHARVRVDQNGELHVAGAVMSGYLGAAPVAADEIATGDLGEIDADGFVRVRGRVKNLIITSMGRNIAPEWPEMELKGEPVIAQAMVYGEARPFLTALLSPVSAQVTHEMLAAAVQRANSRLPDYARVRAWALFPETPSVDNGLLTANGRLRRAALIERCGGQLEALYIEDSFDVVS